MASCMWAIRAADGTQRNAYVEMGAIFFLHRSEFSSVAIRPSTDPRFPPSRFVRPSPSSHDGTALDRLCGRGSYKPKRLPPVTVRMGICADWYKAVVRG